MSLTVKHHWGEGDGKRKSSPRPGKCGEPKSPGSSTPESIIIKASQLAQRYHNPDPLLRLIGPVNEAKVLVDDHEFPALKDSGAQLTQMSLSLVKKLSLPIHTLNTIIEAEPPGGGKVAYLGYVEARLKIPGIEKMDKDSLFMVINDSPYTERVPITIGALYIRQALKLTTKEELINLPEAWKVADFPPIKKQTTISEPILDLNQVQGKVKLTKDVTIGPFDTVYVPGNTSIQKHSKRLNIMVERLNEQNS